MTERAVKPVDQKSVSRDGFEFDPSSLRWRLSANTPINLIWVSEVLDRPVRESFLGVLRFYAETASAHHVSNVADRFKGLALFIARSHGLVTKIRPDDLINYRSSLDATHEWYLGVVSGFLKRWDDMGYHGVDPEVIQVLKSWRLRGNQKGKAVQTLCPYEGALSDFEYESLQQSLVDAFEQDIITNESFILVNLFLATGRRPAQIADLKIRDLVEAKAAEGVAEFILRVPRRKQVGSRWREQFRDYALTPELGVALKSYVKDIQRKFRDEFGYCSDIGDLAMFPSWKRLREYNKNDSVNHREMLSGQSGHQNPTTLGARIKPIVKSLDVYSERTGETLEVTPIRLRRTLGTRAAREGYGELIIAELLDHSDTQNAGVYVENVPEHVDAINRAVAEQLAPIAQAFEGVLVDREFDAERGDDLSSRVRSGDSGKGVGTCGHHGFCGAFAPIACYTCRHYQPWLDGPHEEVLDGLIAQREKTKEQTGDMTMASVNDRTIFAVEQVVQLCAARKREHKEGSD